MKLFKEYYRVVVAYYDMNLCEDDPILIYKAKHAAYNKAVLDYSRQTGENMPGPGCETVIYLFDTRGGVLFQKTITRGEAKK